MRYYVGVDWADQTHAVWVVDERGTKVTGRTVPHTAAGFSEWGRELDEWRVPVPAHVVRAKARLMQSLVEQLTLVVVAVAQYRTAIDDFFARMPAAQWARTLPIGKHGITAPTLWARLGDAPGRWESFRHLQAQAGAVPVTKRSGKQRVVPFRFACDKSLRHVVDQVAFLSLLSSDWARAYYDQQRARGHAHHQALRALGAKWLKIIFVMWHRQVPYDEQYHLATMTRQQLRQHQTTIA
ncbi:MAG TPA: transposase [Verrucomicrobiae bacterium]|nr:transposase [Verrucomicrobiae bacterium]